MQPPVQVMEGYVHASAQSASVKRVGGAQVEEARARRDPVAEARSLHLGARVLGSLEHTSHLLALLRFPLLLHLRLISLLVVIVRPHIAVQWTQQQQQQRDVT